MRDLKYSILSLVLVVTTVVNFHHLGLEITNPKKIFKNTQKKKNKIKQKTEIKRKGQNKVNSNLVRLKYSRKYFIEIEKRFCTHLFASPVFLIKFDFPFHWFDQLVWFKILLCDFQNATATFLILFYRGASRWKKNWSETVLLSYVVYK